MGPGANRSSWKPWGSYTFLHVKMVFTAFEVQVEAYIPRRTAFLRQALEAGCEAMRGLESRRGEGSF